MRSYSINLEGRVKNFPLPKNRPLVPLYEAVVNSIHAIEERQTTDNLFTDGKIIIEIIRPDQIELSDTGLPAIGGFKITDNGIGFNEQNMTSFLESDSTYKSDIGGKGVGRFSWLKAFEFVSINSTFKDDESFLNRDFTFNLSNSRVDDTLTKNDNLHDYSTSVTLNTYLPNYIKYVPKQINTIAMRIIQHCLVYFLDNNCPQIIIKDAFDNINLNSLFKKKFKSEDNVSLISINGVTFNLLNIRIDEQAFTCNKLYLCANNRLVKSRDLEKLIVDLDGDFFKRCGFWYIGVLTSPYLDNHVDMNRLSFDIAESGRNLFEEVSLEEIITNTCISIEKYLHEFLKPISDEKMEDFITYATTTAPQFRHLIKYMYDEIMALKPNLTPDELDDALYEIKRTFDKQAKEEQKKLFEQTDETSMPIGDYELFFQEQIEKISDANSSVLAEYVAHRRVIIELFERGLRRQDSGKFNKEKYMHNLIYPMRKTSDDIDYEAHNLWLIDEKLSYCNFISSDIPFDNDNTQGRSDILFLDNPVAVADEKNSGEVFDTIIIFELKRPMRNDYSNNDNPITQLYDYVEKIRSGKAKDKHHRLIKVNSSTKYYLYAVCDVTSKLERFTEQYSFTATPDGLGYYCFNDRYNSYFEILSFDKILNDARKRNRVLFDKLGV